MNKEELKKILYLHSQALQGLKTGEHANLSYENLNHANLTNADLSHAYLNHANLSHADLTNANLSHANLSHANLSHANLNYADLRHTDLKNANLNHAYYRKDIEIGNNPIQILCLKWWVFIMKTHIKIGCKIHSFEEWENFTDARIAKMDKNALDFWKKWKEPLLAMAKYK